jgi:hypothetical protein
MSRQPYLLPLVCLGTLLIAGLTFIAGLAVGAHMAETRLLAMLQEDPDEAQAAGAAAGLRIPVPHPQGGGLRLPQTPQLRPPRLQAPRLRGPQLTGGQLQGRQLTGGQLRMPGGGLSTPGTVTIGGAAAGAPEPTAPSAEPEEPAVAAAGNGTAEPEPAVADAPAPVSILPALHDASLREEVAARMRAVPAALEVAAEDEPPPATAAETLTASLRGALVPAGAVGDDAPAYTVELALFRELGNARALERDLLAGGHPARVVIDDPTLERPWYAVTLGRYATRRQAEQAAYRLWRSDGLHGSVVLVYPPPEEQG